MAYGNKNPPNYADVRMATGDQRSGKSNTLVGFSVDDYYKNLTGIISPNGQVVKAKSIDKTINPEDYNKLITIGLNPNKLKYVRVYSNDEKQSKLIQIPRNYIVQSPVKIFANFHLFGIKYVPISLEFVLEHMNTDMFNDSWILSDESVMTDARNSMTKMGKIIAAFGATIGKRNATFCIAAQYNEMVERRFRLFATTTINCTYDGDTKYIYLTIRKKGEPEFETSFYAPLYWPFFNTRELISVPQHKIDSAVGKYGDGSLAKQVVKLKNELERAQKELSAAEEANLILRQALRV